MKIMTLNADFLKTDHSGRKLKRLAERILREKPDVITMQKVYQSANAVQMPEHMLAGQYSTSGGEIRMDNLVARLAQYLQESGLKCSWVWAAAGGEDRDEGMAILCLGRKIRNTDQFPISRISHDPNTNPRAALGVQLEGIEDWFYALRMNAWEDQDESFLEQWTRLNCCIASKRLCSSVWLTGDLNASEDFPDRSYRHMLSGGWQDTCDLTQHKDIGFQRSDRPGRSCIMCNQKKEILSSGVIFNEEKETTVSKRFGIITEVKEQII